MITLHFHDFWDFNCIECSTSCRPGNSRVQGVNLNFEDSFSLIDHFKVE